VRVRSQSEYGEGEGGELVSHGKKVEENTRYREMKWKAEGRCPKERAKKTVESAQTFFQNFYEGYRKEREGKQKGRVLKGGRRKKRTDVVEGKTPPRQRDLHAFRSASHKSEKKEVIKKKGEQEQLKGKRGTVKKRKRGTWDSTDYHNNR